MRGRGRYEGIPAIVRIYGKVRGGTLHWDPLATMGYRFEYVDHKGHVANVDGRFHVIYRYPVASSDPWFDRPVTSSNDPRVCPEDGHTVGP